MPIESPDRIKTANLVNYMNKFKSGPLYSANMMYGSKFITKPYSNISDELNLRKFYCMSPRSYSPVQKYYTVPMGEDYIDNPPIEPYGVPATQPIKPNANTTPELLIEPFMDELAFTYHTVMELFDLHDKKLIYEIVKDEDVVTIYGLLTNYLDSMQNVNLTGKYEFTNLLNRMSKFKNDLTDMFKRACHRNNWKIADNTFIRLINQLVK